MQEKNIPKHYREYKYQQNRPVSPSRQAEKEKRIEERNEKHKEIMEEYQKEFKYYDE